MYKNIKTFINLLRMLATITFFIGMPYAYAQVENTKEAAVDQNTLASPVEQNTLASPAEQNISVLSVDDEQSSRNPFQQYIIPEEEPVVKDIPGAGQSSGVSSDDSKNKFDYSSLRVTGSVWGNNMPKAIINDQVMGIGDVVNEAKILNIAKEGILFEFKDKQYLMKREGVSGR